MLPFTLRLQGEGLYCVEIVMSLLKIFDDSTAVVQEVMSQADDIAIALRGVGVEFERWEAVQPLGHQASQEDVIAAYRAPIDQLMARHDFQSVDVIALTSDHPDREALRAKFLAEHIHSDFEIRFFVSGAGLFYIHADERVYGVRCEEGDLISVPANTKHWFDMGEAPDFRCIRLFTDEAGWVASYTGDAIASRFPTFEQFDV